MGKKGRGTSQDVPFLCILMTCILKEPIPE